MTPFFFGPAERRLYGVYHPPAPANRTALQVLLCAPFGQEAVRTHRLHRLLAEQLARQGFHVMRFDYHGTGESSGEDTEGSLAQWQEDILAAQEELGRRTRARETVWVGARLGGTLALLASARSATPPLRIVLWEPVLDGPTYVQELAVAHVKHTFDPFIHRHKPQAELRHEALGIGVSDAWLTEMRSVSLERIHPSCLQACYHVATAPTPAAQRLSERLQAHGADWRYLPTQAHMDWHTEEAGGSALAPPELLRLLTSAIKGEVA